MIIVAYGGTGSTYIRDRAEELYGEKNCFPLIDVDFKPPFWGEGNSCAVKSYDEKPGKKIRQLFYDRTGYSLKEEESISIGMKKFLDSKRHYHFLHFSFASYYEFLRKMKVAQVLFVIRHPVSQMVSYLHPEKGTHGVDAVANGLDITTIEGAKIFARVWKKTIQEYFEMLRIGLMPGLVMYEKIRWAAVNKRFIRPELAKLFRYFYTGKDHFGEVSDEIHNVVRDIVSPEFQKLYGNDWFVKPERAIYTKEKKNI